jgi:hypothetical protein
MGKNKLTLRIKNSDRVHLKENFKRYMTALPTGVTYIASEMGIYQGQQVQVTSLHITYHHGIATHSITCSMINDCKIVRLPLICINRALPLIRDGKKISLHHKELIIDLGS